MNDRKAGQWGQEEYQPLIVMQDDSSAVKVFNPGLTTQILIKCELSHFKVCTDLRVEVMCFVFKVKFFYQKATIYFIFKI